MKKYIFTIFITLIAIFCIVSPLNMILATKSGLYLWATVIIPALFPFMIIADLIQKTAIPFILGKILNPVMKPLFNLPGISSLAIFLGMTGGYPIGAKITTDFVNKKIISTENANHLITFANNSGPLFLLGAVGIGIYNNSSLGILLLISHYIAAILVGIIFKIIMHNKNNLELTSNQTNFQVIKLSQIGSILNETIKKSIDVTLSIGGFIILFSIISSILEQTGILNFLAKIILPSINLETSKAIIIGSLEVTNGINKIATLNIPLLQKLLITSILIGFGGMSIHFQTLSILSNSAIKFKNYILGKTLHGIISGILTFLLLHFTNFSTLIPKITSINIEYDSVEFMKILNTIFIFLTFTILFKLFQTIKSHKT